VLYGIEKYNFSDQVFEMFESAGYDLMQIAKQSGDQLINDGGDQLMEVLENGSLTIKRVKCLQTLTPGFVFPVTRRLPVYPDWSSMCMRGMSATIVCLFTPRGEWTLVTVDERFDKVYKNYCEYRQLGHPLVGNEKNVLEYMRMLLMGEDPCFQLLNQSGKRVPVNNTDEQSHKIVRWSCDTM
jgi:hypothetical protein